MGLLWSVKDVVITQPVLTCFRFIEGRPQSAVKTEAHTRFMRNCAGDGENKTDSPDLVKAPSLAGNCNQFFAIFFLCWRSKKDYTTAELSPSIMHACTQHFQITAHLILSSSSTSLQVRRPSLSRWQIISYPILLMKSSVWNHNTHFYNVQICRVKIIGWGLMVTKPTSFYLADH